MGFRAPVAADPEQTPRRRAEASTHRTAMAGCPETQCISCLFAGAVGPIPPRGRADPGAYRNSRSNTEAMNRSREIG
jgi:hypothetical protein